MTPRQRQLNLHYFLNEVKKACKKNERPFMNHLCRTLGITPSIQIVLQNKGYIRRTIFGKYEWLKDVDIDQIQKDITIYNRERATALRRRKGIKPLKSKV